MKRVSLAAIAEINPPKPAGLGANRGSSLVPFLPMSSVSEEGYATYDERRPVNDLRKGYTYFEKGDVLLAKITPCLENGKAALVTDLPGEIGFGSTEFHVLRPGPDVHDRYLFHAVWNPAFRTAAAASFTGSAGQKRLPTSFFERYRVPLPSLPEQRRIAAMLDKADTVRRKRREGLKLLDEFLRSVFLEMFGDPIRNEEGWDAERLEALADIVSGVTKGRKLKGSEIGSAPYLRVANVQDGYLDLREVKSIDATHEEVGKYVLRQGDILLTEGGDADKLGRGAVWRGEIEGCIHQNHVFRVRLNTDRLLPDFVAHLLGSGYGKRYFMRAAKQTTGIASINRTQLGGFPTLVPPIGLQIRFAKVVERHRQIGAALKAAAQTTTMLSQALSANVFDET